MYIIIWPSQIHCWNIVPLTASTRSYRRASKVDPRSSLSRTTTSRSSKNHLPHRRGMMTKISSWMRRLQLETTSRVRRRMRQEIISRLLNKMRMQHVITFNPLSSRVEQRYMVAVRIRSRRYNMTPCIGSTKTIMFWCRIPRSLISSRIRGWPTWCWNRNLMMLLY